MNRSPITSKDLSFVVQGPVVTHTKALIDGIRNYYPESKIILSTWSGTSVDQLPVDHVILSEDPGSFLRDEENRIFHNANRQILSTVRGLEAVTTKYAVKIRSDLIIQGDHILHWLNSPERRLGRQQEYSFLLERALVTNVTTVNPRKVEPLPFHPCDWFYCGRTEDLLQIWAVPMFPEPLYTHWFKERPKPKNFPFPTSLARFHPENYVWTEFLKKHLSFPFEHSSDNRKSNIELSEASFANNLVILSNEQIGLVSRKHALTRASMYRMYTHEDWRRLVRRYADSSVRNKLPFENIEHWVAHMSIKLRRTFILRKLRSLLR
jgi:WavE lipopolysaccharide synthesis